MVRWGVAFAWLVMSLFAGGLAHAAPVETTLAAKIQGSNPLKPSLILTNTAKTACQVAVTAFGTVSLTRVTQGGKVIAPQPTDVASDEAVDARLAQQLTTLKPGGSVSIPLRVSPVGSRHVLESVVWAPATGLYGMQYAISDEQPLDIEASYDAPLATTNGAPMCGVAYTAVTAASAHSVGRYARLAGVAVIIATIVAVAAVAVWLVWQRQYRPALRPKTDKTKKTKIAAVLLVAGVAGFTLWHAPSAGADYSVPSSASSQFDECMATFNEHRDITGPILDALASQHIEIVPTDDLTNDTARYGEHDFRIYWDPDHLGTYAGHDPGSPPVVSYPCPRLFHEMYHAYDMLNGTFSRDDCAGSGIETKEVMATRAENALRQALGMPPRTHYGHDRLPSGSCTPPPPPSPSCSSAACGQSNGDPHIVTFDGLRYDFQAVGEFVTARDPAGDFEVHTRQQPFPGSRTVSINTAVAMRVSTDKVEISITQGRIVLLVNDKAQPLPKQTTKLKGGGTLIPLTTQLTRVQWPDGSFATLEVIGSWGLHLTLDVANDRQGKLEGLLGNFNGNSKDDLVIRGTKTAIQPTFSQIFPKFADSWRVDDKSSLFTYDKDASTKTYTDRGFPDKQVDATQVPGKAAAEALCRNLGVSDAASLTDCIVDVALTGRPEFALAATHGQYANAFGGKTFEINISTPGASGSAAFDGVAGQKIFVDIPHSTFPDQCGGVWLQAPDGNSIATGCIIGNKGMIDGTILPATGTYHVIIDPTEDHTGNAVITVITDADQIGQITPDGSPVQAITSRPGAVARFNFNGQAGERLFLRMPASTLPDQCGGFDIRDAANSSLGQGCVIGGSGFVDTVQLPTTGTYSVLIDPTDHNVGQTTLQLIVVRDISTGIAIGGPAITANLSMPGATATFTFTGTAGERVFVNASNATLSDQCGGFELHAPGGQSIATGCLIGGKGTIDEHGTVLPATGTYSVVVDPPDTNSGQVTLRVHR